MNGLPCSVSFLFKLWEVFLFPVFAGAHLRQVLVDSMVDQQKTWGDDSTNIAKGTTDPRVEFILPK